MTDIPTETPAENTQPFPNGYHPKTPVAASWRAERQQVHADLLDALSELNPDDRIIEIVDDGLDSWLILTVQGSWRISRDGTFAARRLAKVRTDLIRRQEQAAEERKLTPEHASLGLLPGREATVADRIGGFLQVVSHGPLYSSEINAFDGTEDADVEYIEVVRTRPTTNQRYFYLLTPEAAVALGERMAELGREALARRSG